MPLTVRQLTEIPHLGIRLVAGRSGWENEISWAHAIEIARPWRWLEAGDLLMTTGLGVPPAPAAQTRYVRELSAAGVGGIAVGEGLQAPPLSPVMRQAAEEHRLPILSIAYEVPFAQISRAVAQANRGAEHARLVRTARVYDRVRSTIATSEGVDDVLAVLEGEIGCALSVVADRTGAVLVRGSVEPGRAVLDALRSAIDDAPASIDGMRRLPSAGAIVSAIPVPARRPLSLLAFPGRDGLPPYALLQHVATLSGLLVERIETAREERRRLGAGLLSHILDGRSPSIDMESLLGGHWLGSGPYQMVVAATHDDDDAVSRVHHTLSDHGVGHLMLCRDGMLHLLVRDDGAAVAQIVTLPGIGSHVGVSETFQAPAGAAAATVQARWALEHAREQQTQRVSYGDAAPLFGPRTVNEARAAVTNVLGLVIAYDNEHGTELVPSLEAFLRCNRSWHRAAAELYVHRQTLVYRMRRLERLTGRSLASTGDVAELWYAVRAMQRLGLSTRSAVLRSHLGRA